MDSVVKFRRNVFVILIAILLLAILTQVARSQFVLQFNQNQKFVAEYKQLTSMDREQAGAVDPAYYRPMTDEVYCIVYQSQHENSLELANNAEQTLTYMKRETRLVDADREAIPYDVCTSVMLATDDLDAVEGAEAIDDFVREGGSAILLCRPEGDRVFRQIYRKLGIIVFANPYLTNGIHLTSNVLVGEKGLQLGDDFIYNLSLRVELDDESTLLAESLQGVPLMWKRDYGDGTFVVFNGDSLHLKSSRGLLAGGISMLYPDYLYPIFNSKVFYIDDFPAPLKKGSDHINYELYGMDIPEFFKRIWWPDMLKVSKKYNIVYTAVAIQTYNDRVSAPFQDAEGEERHNLISFGREVIKSGGELGIHGYNHQSLQMNQAVADSFGYNKWNSTDDMEESIQHMLKYMHNSFPNYTPLSYVPPSNVLGVEGRKALKRAWPDLAVIASLYDTDFSDIAYVQEYGIAADGVIELPRVTSLYYEDPYFRWLEANTITSIGIFSHFIHPDDLLDDERNDNQTWDVLYERFSDYLGRLNQTYPWLRSMTSIEAGLDMARAIQTEVKLSSLGSRINGEAAEQQGKQYYILRSDKKIASEDNCSVVKIDDGVYLVTVTGSKFSIGLGR